MPLYISVKDSEPEISLDPLQSPAAEQVEALVDDHVSVWVDPTSNGPNFWTPKFGAVEVIFILKLGVVSVVAVSVVVVSVVVEVDDAIVSPPPPPPPQPSKDKINRIIGVFLL